jgi:O-antigen/teichoic acid export membrane protein
MTSRLGAGDYGIFLLINAISSFINYVDLGLGTAITKYVAEYNASKNTAQLKNMLGSARTLFFFTGLLGLIIFTVIGKWFLPAFQITGAEVNHIFWVFLFAGITFLFTSLNVVYGSVLSALERFDLTTKVSMVGLIINSVSTILLLENGFQLKAVMALNMVLSFAALVVYHFYAKRLLPEVGMGLIFDKSEIVKAYKFGFLSFISNLATSCLVYLDRLIIPMFLGPAHLAFYSVPGNVALKTTGVTNSLAGMFFPMASAFSGSGEIDRLKNIYIRAFRNLSVVAAATTMAIILFGYKILYFWLGQEYADKGIEVLIIVTITYYIVSLYSPLQYMLLGMGRFKFLITLSLSMAAANLVLLLILVPKYGIVGAAWAYLISVLPMAYGFYWAEKNIFMLVGQAGRYIKLYAKLIFVAIVDAAIIYYLLLPLVNSIWYLVVIGPLSVLLYLAIYYICRFSEKEDEALVLDFLKKFLRLT